MVTKQLKVLRSNEIIDFIRRISLKGIQKKDYNNLYIRADKSFSENLFEDFRFSLQKDLINSKIIPRGTRL